MQYDYILDRGETSWGGRVPAVPGAYAVGATREETERLLGEAVECVVDIMRGADSPRPRWPPMRANFRPAVSWCAANNPRWPAKETGSARSG